MKSIYRKIGRIIFIGIFILNSCAFPMETGSEDSAGSLIPDTNLFGKNSYMGAQGPSVFVLGHTGRDESATEKLLREKKAKQELDNMDQNERIREKLMKDVEESLEDTVDIQQKKRKLKKEEVNHLLPLQNELNRLLLEEQLRKQKEDLLKDRSFKEAMRLDQEEKLKLEAAKRERQKTFSGKVGVQMEELAPVIVAQILVTAGVKLTIDAVYAVTGLICNYFYPSAAKLAEDQQKILVGLAMEVQKSGVEIQKNRQKMQEAKNILADCSNDKLKDLIDLEQCKEAKQAFIEAMKQQRELIKNEKLMQQQIEAAQKGEAGIA